MAADILSNIDYFEVKNYDYFHPSSIVNRSYTIFEIDHFVQFFMLYLFVYRMKKFADLLK
jgi:hypothetical protein